MVWGHRLPHALGAKERTGKWADRNRKKDPDLILYDTLSSWKDIFRIFADTDRPKKTAFLFRLSSISVVSTIEDSASIMETETLNSIIRQCQEDSTEALRQLLKVYGPMVFSVAMKMLNDQQEAEATRYQQQFLSQCAERHYFQTKFLEKTLYDQLKQKRHEQIR